jgi:hypothetical protein
MWKIGDLQFPFKQDKLRRLARIHEYKSAPTHNTRHSKTGLFTLFFTRLYLEKARCRRHPEERRATLDTQADLIAATQAALVTPHDRLFPTGLTAPEKQNLPNIFGPGLFLS